MKPRRKSCTQRRDLVQTSFPLFNWNYYQMSLQYVSELDIKSFGAPGFDVLDTLSWSLGLLMIVLDSFPTVMDAFAVQVGETLLELIIDTEDAPKKSDGPSENSELEDNSSNPFTESPKSEKEEEEGGKGFQATPAVRHLAKSYGISLADVPGSGNDGRILKGDVLNFVMAKEELNEEIRSIDSEQGRGGALFHRESSDSESDWDILVSKGADLLSKEDRVGEVSTTTKPVSEDVLHSDKIIPIRCAYVWTIVHSHYTKPLLLIEGTRPHAS